tara:strand:- start:2154 stop:2423 length:270 start_codon:yes stop_codon:yes gene_type:complete
MAITFSEYGQWKTAELEELLELEELEELLLGFPAEGDPVEKSAYPQIVGFEQPLDENYGFAVLTLRLGDPRCLHHGKERSLVAAEQPPH